MVCNFRLSLIYAKFDEVARSGNMVVEEDSKCTLLLISVMMMAGL